LIAFAPKFINDEKFTYYLQLQKTLVKITTITILNFEASSQMSIYSYKQANGFLFSCWPNTN